MTDISHSDFQALYHLHSKMVYNLALHYVQNSEDAEEITQDVFLSVFEKIGQFKFEAELKTWIYRITINKSLDFIKAKTRKKRLFIFTPKKEIDFSNSVAEFNHPGVLMEQKEELAKLFAGINQLPEQQKTAIILLKIEQHSQAQAAEIMQVSEKAIESLFQRAKGNLKRFLQENEG